jgi:threonine dehydrogenase-like Zn-dependent dehydrogenase
MSSKYERYRSVDHVLPDRAWAWNMYGAGLENIGRGGQPEQLPIADPADDQLLARIDCVGLCFSDLKVVKQGSSHPKLYGRDLSRYPARLGHEVSLTIVKVGKGLQDRYRPCQRFAVQPDIYQNGKNTAYGYTVPGGLIQYQLIGPEVLQTDEGACLLPLPAGLGYAETALLEPWGCVVAAYTQRRRLQPRPGGTLWIVGRPGDERAYIDSAGLAAPAVIVLTDAPASVRAMAETAGAGQVVARDGVGPAGYAALAEEFTGGQGFDDIVALDPRSAAAVGAMARHIARRGILNLVGETPLDGLVDADVGRLHYDYIVFAGNRGPDIAASYGEARNRCRLRPGGTAVFLGAGGPMGQMHVQLALELPGGPAQVIASEVSEERLAALRERFSPLAAQKGRRLALVNPSGGHASLHDLVMEATGGRGADDVVVCVPVAALMAEGAGLMNADGMLVAFAGVPNGTLAPLDLSQVYLGSAQFSGTSGLTIKDQAWVLQRAAEGSLSPGRSVAAIGGLDAAVQGIEAMMNGRYPGKIVIFPQLPALPLLGLDELSARLPQVAEKLGPGNVWTAEAEAALFEAAWQG